MLRLADITSCLGSVSHQGFYDELNRAHVLVAPSQRAPDGDTEGGAPTVLIEAQAAGVPVVAYRHCDIPEVVLDGQSGLLAPEGDCDGLGERLREVLTHPERWAAFGRAGRAHVEAHYNILTEAPVLEARYAQCLEQPHHL
jgi:colanic acid/amylovoran biosynthesis glycosyltransferase